MTVRELEADLGIPKTSMAEILMQDLDMKCVVVKFVPWLLLSEQKEHRAAVANDTARTMRGPEVPPLRGTEGLLFYTQCFLYLVSSSINISIFHITWVDTF